RLGASTPPGSAPAAGPDSSARLSPSRLNAGRPGCAAACPASGCGDCGAADASGPWPTSSVADIFSSQASRPSSAGSPSSAARSGERRASCSSSSPSSARPPAETTGPWSGPPSPAAPLSATTFCGSSSSGPGIRPHSSSGSVPGGSTSSWLLSLARRCRTQRAASQPERLAASSASSKITAIAGSESSAPQPSRASSISGSSATNTARGAAAVTSPIDAVSGSATATTSAPASPKAACRRSRASPSRASSATRAPCSLIRLLHAQQFVHVVDQLGLLVRLAEGALHADLERALAVLLAGAPGDHHDRRRAQPRFGLHVVGQLVDGPAQHLDVQQHGVRHPLVHALDRVDAIAGGHHLEVVALEHAAGDLAHGDRVVHHHHQRDLAPLLGVGGRDVLRLRGLAPDQGGHVEDHPDAAIAHDRGAEDARNGGDLRADRLHHDFPVAQ